MGPVYVSVSFSTGNHPLRPITTLTSYKIERRGNTLASLEPSGFPSGNAVVPYWRRFMKQFIHAATQWGTCRGGRGLGSRRSWPHQPFQSSQQGPDRFRSAPDGCVGVEPAPVFFFGQLLYSGDGSEGNNNGDHGGRSVGCALSNLLLHGE